LYNIYNSKEGENHGGTDKDGGCQPG